MANHRGTAYGNDIDKIIEIQQNDLVELDQNIIARVIEFIVYMLDNVYIISECDLLIKGNLNKKKLYLKRKM